MLIRIVSPYTGCWTCMLQTSVRKIAMFSNLEAIHRFIFNFVNVGVLLVRELGPYHDESTNIKSQAVVEGTSSSTCRKEHKNQQHSTSTNVLAHVSL